MSSSLILIVVAVVVIGGVLVCAAVLVAWWLLRKKPEPLRHRPPVPAFPHHMDQVAPARVEPREVDELERLRREVIRRKAEDAEHRWLMERRAEYAALLKELQTATFSPETPPSTAKPA